MLEKPVEAMARHIKPLFIQVHLEGVPVSRVLVDNGAAVNILPSSMIKKLGKTEKEGFYPHRCGG